MKPTPEVVPEVILPEQFWPEPEAPLAGEVGLLWTVLEDGVRSYREAVLRGATSGYDFRETREWIFGPQRPHVTSFDTLCGIFGISPTRLRMQLLRFRDGVERRFADGREAGRAH